MTITTLSVEEFDRDANRAMRAAAEGPVFITGRGGPTHVLLAIEDYLKLTSAHANIVDMLAMPEASDIEFEAPRLRGPISHPAEVWMKDLGHD